MNTIFGYAEPLTLVHTGKYRDSRLDWVVFYVPANTV